MQKSEHKHFDFAIIGGGISGLYAAYKLHQKFGTNNIIVIEKDKRLGGRIFSSQFANRNVELGAGVVLENHNLVLDLVKDLGLTDQLIYNKSKKFFLDTNNGIIDDVSNLGFKKLVNELAQLIKNPINKNIAKKYSLYRFIERMYDTKTANMMNSHYGYDGDFIDQNAIVGIKMLETDFETPKYFFKNGYSHLIETLYKHLISNNIKVLLNTACNDITIMNNHYICYVNGDNHFIQETYSQYTAKNVVLAIPKYGLCKLPILYKIKDNLLNAVSSIPLIRVYMSFDVCWFDHLESITTSTMLRQIIFYDKKKNVIMIYATGKAAYDIYCLGSDMIPELMFWLRKMFNKIEIPDPKDSVYYLWEKGTHVWKPSVNFKNISNNILKPFDNQNIFIVGEAYSNKQQWCQGALESVNRFINLL